MAIINSPTFNTTNGDVKFRIVVNEMSTSTENNTSTVSIQVQAWSTNSRTSLTYAGKCFLKIDGTEIGPIDWSQGQKTISLNSYTPLYVHVTTITHNNDGFRSINVAAYFILYDEGNYIVSSSYRSFNTTLMPLQYGPTILNAVDDVVLNDGDVSLTFYITKRYKNAVNGGLSILKMQNSSVICTEPVVIQSLNNGKNTITLSSSSKQSLLNYMELNNLNQVEVKYRLSTTGITERSFVTGVIKRTVTYGQPLVSFRPGKVGINNTNPQTALDVDGDITCDHITMNDPQYEVEDGVLKIYSAFPLYRVENGVLIIIN